MSHAPAAQILDDAHTHAQGKADDHGHHGHHIVPRRVLLTVLALLMFFTLLTVGAAQLESYISVQFNVIIPQWVNVAVALSIAAVKCVIVAAYFMQLKYDNPLNTLVMAFTIFTLAFFLGFIMIDLGNRDAIYAYKMKQIVAGGSGNIVVGKDSQGNDISVPAGTSITTQARATAMSNLDSMLQQGKRLPPYMVQFAAAEIERRAAVNALLIKDGKPAEALPPQLVKFEKLKGQYAADIVASHGGHGGQGGEVGNTANRARVKTGVTLPELGGAAKGDGHGAADEANGKKPAEQPKR